MSDDIEVKLINNTDVSQADNYLNFKIIIVGESGVGKSCILQRAVLNEFSDKYQATLGFEFLCMHFQVNEMKIKLQIWDTCGQETYRSLVQGFYRNTSLCLIVYDIQNKDSFKAVDVWIKDIKNHIKEEIPLFVAGNKNDLQREVPLEDAQLFTSSNRIKYFTECSAKLGRNVKEIFEEAAKCLYKQYKEYKSNNRNPSTSTKLKIDSNKDDALLKKKKKCC